MLIKLLILVITIFALVSDLKSETIPNYLTGPLIIFGIGVTTIYYSTIDPILFLGSIAIIIVLFTLFLAGGIGGGDAKLLIGMQLCTTHLFGISLVLGVFMCGALFSIIAIIKKEKSFKYAPAIFMGTLLTILFY